MSSAQEALIPRKEEKKNGLPDSTAKGRKATTIEVPFYDSVEHRNVGRTVWGRKGENRRDSPQSDSLRPTLD